MDMFKGNPDEDNMMDVEPWLSVPGSSGLDDPAEGMFPDASPAPNLPGSPTMHKHVPQQLAHPAVLQQQQPWQQQQQQQQQQRQQTSPGLPPWPGMGQPHLQQQQQHMWQSPPGALHMPPQQQHHAQLPGMVPMPQPGGFPAMPAQQQLQIQRMQQQMLAQRQFQQMPPQMRMQLMQQQHMMMQARQSDSQGGTGSNPPSAPGSPRAGQLSRQNSMQQLDRQVSTSSAGEAHPMKLDAAALLAVAAPKPKKKQYASSAGGGVGNKKAAAAAAAAGAAYTALWKHTGPPREPRIVREAGIEYEEILPPGLPVANTRPLPVPVELFQLSSLSDILSLDTWKNELDDAERAALRALLPNKGEGFSEEPGGHLDKLLSGTDNIFFGNPTAQVWEALSSGSAAPRARRQQELLLQIKQQLAAADLRSYHNQQVSTFLAMQRLWDATLPPDAPIPARLAAWAAAKAGEIDIPESPRAAVQAAWAEEVHKAAQEKQQREAAVAEKHAGAADQQQQHHRQAQGYGGQRQQQMHPAQQAAAGARGQQQQQQQQGVVVGSSHGDFVYETGVNFSRHLTKRQQAALAQQQQQQQGGPGAAPAVPAGLTPQQQQQQLLQQLQQVQQMQQQQQAGMQGRAVPGSVPLAPQQQQQPGGMGVPAVMPQQLQYRMAAQQLQLQQAAMQAQQLQQQVRSQLAQMPLQQQQQLQQMLMQRQLQMQQQQQPHQ